MKKKSFARSSPKKGKCALTLAVRYKACMCYADVVLNKVLHNESSGKQSGERGSNTGRSQV